MEIPQFIAGSEKKFFDFLSKLNDSDKIALISHTDLDGIVAAKIANEILNANIVKFISYSDMDNKLIKELKNNKVTKVVFTDLLIEDPLFIENIQKFADILIIDHHLFKQDYNSEEVVFINSEGYCASYLSYALFSKVQDLEKLDWLVALASIADWFYFKNQNFMKKTFEKYGDEFIIKDNSIRKSGIFWNLQWDISLALIYYRENLRKVYDSLGPKFPEIGNLKQASKAVQNDIDSEIKRFDLDKEQYKEVIFYEVKSQYPVSSFVSSILSSKYQDNTLVIVRSDDKYYHVSTRRQDGKVNMNQFLKDVLEGLEDSSGGGHQKAGGAHFLKKDLEEFKKRLKN
jgi:single-stranded DNA-specific DHH superfamily exonuclease